ncbi:hypothetical protein [Paenibacillus sp. XY044]|uniref:hypothetical protein n=1 Tax=Paenibacillus sp. XY044 TaxID=2026089 RepID=UPI000B981D13|nr:hypothetical protein [Paenibacillus sp. XY044]OZB98021.1 hypothetical protein CJP46_02320 [Paenibacillus sp. XY044]
MATPNVWAVREVALATFYDLSTGKARVQLTNLKTSGLENTAETVYAKGGRGNANIVGFSGNRGGTVTLQDAVFTNEVIAMMTGNDIATGAKSVYQREALKVASDKVTLKSTPLDAAKGLISVYKLNADGTHGEEITFASDTAETGEYTLAAKVVTFADGEFEDGEEVAVYYKVNTGTTAKTITVSSDKFAGTYKVVLDCLVRNTEDEKDYAAQIVINKAKMEDNWTISMAADGDPSAFDIPMQILKPVNGNELYTMTIYDQNEVA